MNHSRFWIIHSLPILIVHQVFGGPNKLFPKEAGRIQSHFSSNLVDKKTKQHDLMWHPYQHNSDLQGIFNHREIHPEQSFGPNEIYSPSSEHGENDIPSMIDELIGHPMNAHSDVKHEVSVMIEELVTQALGPLPPPPPPPVGLEHLLAYNKIVETENMYPISQKYQNNHIIHSGEQHVAGKTLEEKMNIYPELGRRLMEPVQISNELLKNNDLLDKDHRISDRKEETSLDNMKKYPELIQRLLKDNSEGLMIELMRGSSVMINKQVLEKLTAKHITFPQDLQRALFETLIDPIQLASYKSGAKSISKKIRNAIEDYLNTLYEPKIDHKMFTRTLSRHLLTLRQKYGKSTIKN